MQVVDRLPAVAAAVDDQPVAVFKAERAGQLRGHDYQVAEQVGVVFAGLGE